MWKAGVLVTVLAAVTGNITAQLPCTSQLRIALPDLFKHCETSCHYSTWSPWEVVDKVASTNCTSERVYKETRSRYDYSQVCKNETEFRYTCK